jgi:hypothetical protein
MKKVLKFVRRCTAGMLSFAVIFWAGGLIFAYETALSAWRCLVAEGSYSATMGHMVVFLLTTIVGWMWYWVGCDDKKRDGL